MTILSMSWELYGKMKLTLITFYFLLHSTVPELEWLIYTKAKQRCKQRQNKDVNKDNEIYTKAKQRCKQRQWDIYKG